jgi:glycosyltransferase involved in cell wall biosynthesis
MRVLLVTPWFPTRAAPESGLFVLRDAAALAAASVDVSVLHLDWLHDTDTLAGLDPRVRVRRVRLSRGNPAAYASARRLVRQAAQDVDVVHTHALTGLVPFLVGRPAPRGTPWVHTEHWSGLTSPETLSGSLRAVRRLLVPVLRRPDTVVVACQRLVSTIRATRTGPVEVVPCVVDAPSALVEAPRDPACLRLVGVGGLVDRKGPLTALATLVELHDRGIDATLTWVGDGPLREDMDRAAEQAGLSDRLLLTGTLPPDGVAAELDAADLFILPTAGDNFCIVAAEALVHGRPVVSGSATGAVDYARPSVSELVDGRDPVLYADAVTRLRARTSALSAQDVADTVRGAFGSKVVARLLLDLYGRLTQR